MPELSINALIGYCVVAIITLFINKLIKAALKFMDFRTTLKNMTKKRIKDIFGDWYCSEYDTKYDANDRTNKIAHTIIRIKKKITGKISIYVTKYLDESREHKTSWEAHGKMMQDTIVGEWISQTPQSRRYGSFMLQFLDNGLAAGHWIGFGRSEPYVLYGFMILNKKAEKAYGIANIILDEYKYKSYNTSLIAAIGGKRKLENREVLV